MKRAGAISGQVLESSTLKMRVSGARAFAYVAGFAVSAGCAALLLPQSLVPTAIALILGVLFFRFLQDNNTPVVIPSNASLPLPAQAQPTTTAPQCTAVTEQAVMSPLPPRTPKSDQDTLDATPSSNDSQAALAKHLFSGSQYAPSLTPSTQPGAPSPRIDDSCSSERSECLSVSLYHPCGFDSHGHWQHREVSFSCQTYWLSHVSLSSPLNEHTKTLPLASPTNDMPSLQSSPTGVNITAAPTNTLSSPAAQQSLPSLPPPPSPTPTEWARTLHDFNVPVPQGAQTLCALAPPHIIPPTLTQASLLKSRSCPTKCCRPPYTTRVGCVC